MNFTDQELEHQRHANEVHELQQRIQELEADLRAIQSYHWHVCEECGDRWPCMLSESHAGTKWGECRACTIRDLDAEYDHRKRVEAENAELRKDAERYRWLRLSVYGRNTMQGTWGLVDEFKLRLPHVPDDDRGLELSLDASADAATKKNHS